MNWIVDSVRDLRHEIPDRRAMSGMPREDSEPAEFVLVSASCTTGWFDWVQGELWVTPDGLLRRSLGWAQTKDLARGRKRRGEKAFARTVPVDPLLTRPYERRAIDDLRRESEPVLWLARDTIREAKLRRGLLSSSLRVRLTDGSRAKWFWVKADPAFDVLSTVLSEWLGDSLTVRGRT
jgi:hypothetical protein